MLPSSYKLLDSGIMHSLSIKHSQIPKLKSSTGSEEITMRNEALKIKDEVVPGFYRRFNLENNVYCLCSEYNTPEDFHLHTISLAHEFFIFRLDEISNSCNTERPAKKYHEEVYKKKQSVLLLSSLEEFTFFAEKNSRVKSLEILMPRKWFLDQLNIDCSYEVLKRYMAIRLRKNIVDKNNQLFSIFFAQIIREGTRKVPDFDFISEQVKLLLAILFLQISTDLYEILGSRKVMISKEEIHRLMAVRKHLDTDLPAPTFNSLIKVALMSGTSLKTKFKKMYGVTIFEYFQSMRMQKARILLLTHKYSVKEIGHQLGYSNLSNFTIAFKKEFNELPHELIK